MRKWRAVWKIQLHRTIPWWLLGVTVLSSYVLLTPGPLGGRSPVPALLGVAFGALLGVRLFTEETGTAPFLFSRPVSRSREFWYRWGLGIGLQVGALAILAALMLAGIRQWVQIHTVDSSWYPMVRTYEVSVLWPIGLASLFTYHMSAFLTMRHRLQHERSDNRWKQVGRALVTFGLVFVVFMISGFFLSASGTTQPADGGLRATQWAVVGYLALLIIATTFAAWHCMTRLEVEA